MNDAIILDTHVVLWWLADDDRLGTAGRKLIADPQAEVLVSAATVWEIAIKRQLDKLTAPDDLLTQLRANRIAVIPIEAADAWEAGGLPNHHRDPFDRMIIAQARGNDMPVMTADPDFSAYDVQLRAP